MVEFGIAAALRCTFFNSLANRFLAFAVGIVFRIVVFSVLSVTITRGT